MANLHTLKAHGQSVWVDNISRPLITTGGLQELVNEGVSGVTSNPTLFAKAIGGSSAYDETIAAITSTQPGITNGALAERLMVEDLQMAADILRPVFDRTHGDDGFVSLEVSPGAAADTDATVADARRLWFDVARPNVMIKVPATPAGIPAIEMLTAQGINVNITLMFSIEHYDAVAHAYLRGSAGQHGRLDVSSVASIFVSRLDVLAGSKLEAIGTPEAQRLRGRLALANARRIYRRFRDLFQRSSFTELRRRGGRVQRVLWASTGTKDPALSDVLYIEHLVAPDTVTTVPPATLDAFRDHGGVREEIGARADADDATLASAAALGLDVTALCNQLQEEGVAAFSKSYDELLVTLDEKRRVCARTEGTR